MEQEQLRQETPLIPLLYYIQKVESNIHEIDNDEIVNRIIDAEFSPAIIILLNKNPVTREGFKEWLAGYRNQYDYLEFSFHNQVVVPSDPEGRGGTVGLTVKWTAMGKSDGALYESQLVAVFEVTWFDAMQEKGSVHGKRMITRGYGAFGEITRVTET